MLRISQLVITLSSIAILAACASGNGTSAVESPASAQQAKMDHGKAGPMSKMDHAKAGPMSKMDHAKASSMGKANAARQALDTTQHTPAPLRVRAVAHLDAAPADVWRYVSNHDNLVEYANGTLRQAQVDRSMAMNSNGIGTKRHCETPNGDTFVENVVYFRAPYVFAYQVVENTWGLSDHLAVVSLEPNDMGGTTLVWEQYYNHPNEPMMTQNITGMFQKMIMPFFAQKFGGIVAQG